MIYLEEMGEKWKKYESLIPSGMLRKIQDGSAAAVLSGKLDWSNPKDLEVFRRVMVDDFYVSPWIEERLTRILVEQSLPDEAVKAIRQDWIRQSKSDPVHTKVVEDFLERLQAHSGIARREFLKKELDEALRVIRTPRTLPGMCPRGFLKKFFPDP